MLFECAMLFAQLIIGSVPIIENSACIYRPILDKPVILTVFSTIAHSQHTMIQYCFTAALLIIYTSLVELQSLFQVACDIG